MKAGGSDVALVKVMVEALDSLHWVFMGWVEVVVVTVRVVAGKGIDEPLSNSEVTVSEIVDGIVELSATDDCGVTGLRVPCSAWSTNS